MSIKVSLMLLAVGRTTIDSAKIPVEPLAYEDGAAAPKAAILLYVVRHNPRFHGYLPGYQRRIPYGIGMSPQSGASRP
jgi:hypothetical protein